MTRVTDAYSAMSLRLQAAFGLRREESIKIIPSWADKDDRLRLKDSWTKGGKYREIPIVTAEQRAALDAAKGLAKGASLIPGEMRYRDQLNRFRAQADGEEARLKIAASVDECRTLRADATATARVIGEMQAHIDDARDELEKSNARTASVQHELDHIREATQAELVELKAALGIATSQIAVVGAHEKVARKDQARAQHVLLEAREMASNLRGQVDTLTRQNTDLLDALKSS